LPRKRKRTIDKNLGPTLVALETHSFHCELVKNDYAARERKHIHALKGLSGLAESLLQSSAHFLGWGRPEFNS
jgi:hypothetical protein